MGRTQADRYNRRMDTFYLQDDELSLRGMRADDAAFVQQCRTHPDVVRFQSWRPATVTEVLALAGEQQGRAPGMQEEPFQVVIALRDDQGREHRVGDMGTGAFDPGRQMELGIALHPAWQGRGLASRACRLLLGHLFAAGLHRVTARIDPRNQASLRLFERLGFQYEGLEHQCAWDDDFREWADEKLFAMLAVRWPECDRAR